MKLQNLFLFLFLEFLIFAIAIFNFKIFWYFILAFVGFVYFVILVNTIKKRYEK